ncbi:hypothetical protein HWB90_gp037 [Mycobacterium phage Fowlmouth]|uniref:Uncharacterized protein n=1 Tax=Mycobacterium phage Fowlmouth TaxID=2419978 RepID=A0A3G2KGA5_9CAUD|nr:hypothetical protein HWB90_gp037 [Mycobacterium phage Fowlmouth]AYN57987.1 hypothetical protein SEA_FOWLMOUTH_37 [Mycobacterium phage Fowlmouth]
MDDSGTSPDDPLSLVEFPCCSLDFVLAYMKRFNSYGLDVRDESPESLAGEHFCDRSICFAHVVATRVLWRFSLWRGPRCRERDSYRAPRVASTTLANRGGLRPS